MPEKEKLRIDKYLWSIRLYKTRSIAADAIEKGRVKLSGENIKPSRQVHVGDEYEVRTETKKWTIKVTALLDHRVPYQEAIKHYTDLTPAEELQRMQYEASSFNTGKRLSKVGRPTKKERRDLGDFMGED